MKNLLILFVLILLAGRNIAQEEAVTYVMIETNMGNMKIRLYNKTPKHRDKFISLIKAGHYDKTLFHRVIKDFVIQGGSADSKDARKGSHIGFAEAITIDSELNKECFHKKGAIAAPRQPNRVNCYKESDISQFYIVQGRKYKMEELTYLERKINNPIKKKIKEKVYTAERKALLDKYRAEQKVKEFRELASRIKKDYSFEWEASKDKLELSEDLKKQYSTVGGVQHLDGEYTVFGEVIEGLDVIDKIANLETDEFDRPITDVTIKIRVLK